MIEKKKKKKKKKKEEKEDLDFATFYHGRRAFG